MALVTQTTAPVCFPAWTRQKLVQIINLSPLLAASTASVPRDLRPVGSGNQCCCADNEHLEVVRVPRMMAGMW